MGFERFFSSHTAGRWAFWWASATILVCLACTPDAWFNNTASLGGDTPGLRGDIQVSFINNTPYRAIFTFGTYDPLDPEIRPEGNQFYADSNPANRLEGNSSSIVFTFSCNRAMSVGDSQLITRLNESKDINIEDLDEAALVPGVTFSDRPIDDPDADQPTAGRDGGIVTLQGAEYECESLLVYTFEVDPTQPDGFRIDLEVVVPE